MSERFPGGFVTMTPTAPTPVSAPGVWTLDQALQNQQAGTWPYGGPMYIEDVFSTYLYDGNGTGQTINNGIDLASYGGLVWTQMRTGTANWNSLFDTARGRAYSLGTNQTNVEANSVSTADMVSFNSNGFTLGTSSNTYVNWSGNKMVSWTFRKQKNFFTCLTYTGNGVSGRQIAHDLGSVPGAIIIKARSGGSAGSANWAVYHRSLGNTQGAVLNNTATPTTSSTFWNNTTPTSSVFTVGSSSAVNENGTQYVAYLFAHNAGGFGVNGTDDVITCGSYSGGVASNTVNLGWEPQWLLVKNITQGNQPYYPWAIFDTMRGVFTDQNDNILLANTSNAENGDTTYNPAYPYIKFTPTGLAFEGTPAQTNSSADYIYIAIRRGPMKTPTTGSSVFVPVTYTGNGAARTISYGFPVDVWMDVSRPGTSLASYAWPVFSRTLSVNNALETSRTSSWSGGWGASYLSIDNNIGVNLVGLNAYLNTSGENYVGYGFRCAPQFMNVVCYTGTGALATIAHGLRAVPELMIVKRRDAAGAWSVYAAPLGNTKVTFFDTAATINGFGYWSNTSPTSSVFTVNTNADVNAVGGTYIAYLFATCPGVSKVGTYTGNGSSQTIDCGFGSGARFVLIKRTNAVGDWYFWDSARGIVPANDPHSSLNSTAAEVTTDDSVDADSTGFIVNQVAATNINVNAATYIYLAIS